MTQNNPEYVQAKLIEALTIAYDALEQIAKPSDTNTKHDYHRISRAALRQLAQLTDTVGPSETVPVQSDDKYIVYSDGSCSGNPGPTGYGIVIIKNGTVVK